METKILPELSGQWELELTEVKEEANFAVFFEYFSKQVLSREDEEGSSSLANGGLS